MWRASSLLWMCLIFNFLISQHLDVPSLWTSLKSGFLFLFPLRHPVQKIHKHPCFSSVNKFDIWYRVLDKLPNSILECLQSFKYLHVWWHKRSYTSWQINPQISPSSIPPIIAAFTHILLQASCWWLGSGPWWQSYSSITLERRSATLAASISGDIYREARSSRDNWVYP